MVHARLDGIYAVRVTHSFLLTQVLSHSKRCLYSCRFKPRGLAQPNCSYTSYRKTLRITVQRGTTYANYTTKSTTESVQTRKQTTDTEGPKCNAQQRTNRKGETKRGSEGRSHMYQRAVHASNNVRTVQTKCTIQRAQMYNQMQVPCMCVLLQYTQQFLLCG